jgi:hypothetical protein
LGFVTVGAIPKAPVEINVSFVIGVDFEDGPVTAMLMYFINRLGIVDTVFGLACVPSTLQTVLSMLHVSRIRAADLTPWLAGLPVIGFQGS